MTETTGDIIQTGYARRFTLYTRAARNPLTYAIVIRTLQRMTIRTKVLTVRLTRHELLVFAKAAKHHGLTLSVAARALLASYARSIPK